MQNNQNYNQKINKHRNLIERRIDNFIDEECPINFKNEVKYALTGGHKWRPVLLLAITEMLGEAADKTIDVACAMEFIHCASLIMDDLPSMDNAELRRGAISFHKKFGVAQAEIISHVLVALGYKLFLNNSFILRDKELNGLKLASETIINISIGQSYDIKYTGEKINNNKVRIISKFKSGIFYSSVAIAPAILFNICNKEKKALLKFGENLGMAYTILDDLYDIEGTASKGGKEINKDKNKTTLPKLLGITRAKSELRNYKHKAQKYLDVFDNRNLVLHVTEQILHLRNNV